MTKPTVRDKILDASLAALHGRGFNATSVQDITEAAQVPKGSFYNHFDSKEALGAEIVNVYAERSAALMDVLHDASVTPVARLTRYFVRLTDVVLGGDALIGCLLGNFSAELATQSPLIRHRVQDALAAWTGELAIVIDQARQMGEVPADSDADQLAASVIDSWQGALLRAKAEQSRLPLERFSRQTLPKLLK